MQDIHYPHWIFIVQTILELVQISKYFVHQITIRRYQCVLSGSDNAIQTGITIYAVNSWYDINMSQYYGNIKNDGTGLVPYMWCYDDYTENCVISQNMWNCKETESNSLCFVEDITVSPTSPSNAPTFSP
eukprot:294631_1